MKQKTDDYQTIRIWVKTQRRLKLIAALRHESIVEVLERLSVQELAQLERRGHESVQIQAVSDEEAD